MVVVVVVVVVASCARKWWWWWWCGEGFTRTDSLNAAMFTGLYFHIRLGFCKQ